MLDPLELCSCEQPDGGTVGGLGTELRTSWRTLQLSTTVQLLQVLVAFHISDILMILISAAFTSLTLLYCFLFPLFEHYGVFLAFFVPALSASQTINTAP